MGTAQLHLFLKHVVKDRHEALRPYPETAATGPGKGWWGRGRAGWAQTPRSVGAAAASHQAGARCRKADALFCVNENRSN